MTRPKRPWKETKVRLTRAEFVIFDGPRDEFTAIIHGSKDARPQPRKKPRTRGARP